MSYTPPSGQAVSLVSAAGFVPDPGGEVLLKPASDPTFLSIPFDQTWRQAAPGFTTVPLIQQWSLSTVRFNNLLVDYLWQTQGARFRSMRLEHQHAQSAPGFLNLPLEQAWSLQPFIYSDRRLDQQWRQPHLLIGECRFHAQWLLEATAVWTPVISATIYRFALENPQGRVDIPISNFSGQLRSGEPSYLQVTIPDARTWAEVIADFATQSDTEMVIEAGYRWSDGRFETQEIARTRLRNVRYDIGARSSSVQLDGIDTRINPTPKTVKLHGANYRSQDDAGRVRYRCAMSFDVRPGDTAQINGESFIVGELSYNVTVNNATMEVAEVVA